MRCGYRAYLRKPIKQSQLFDCLVNVIAAKGDGNFEDVDSQLPSAESPGTLPAKSRLDPENTLILPERLPAHPLVLLVEDNPISQRATRVQLEELGYRVHIVNTGEEALDATLRLQYHLILMDCAMPIVDGYQATSKIRKQEAILGRRTPIIAITAHALPGDREKCLAAGMDDYLSKPVSKEDLQQIIVRWLRPSPPGSPRPSDPNEHRV